MTDPDQDGTPRGVGRRTFVKSTAVPTALGGFAGRGVADEDDDDLPTFLVEQGTTEYEITPFEADATIEEYYVPDPKMFVARNADVGTQVVATEPNESELQFFQGSDGLHLVFAHGRHPNGSGSATFEINGLPAGHWSLRDGFQTESENPYQLAWDWGEWGAGGAYRGAFDEEFAVTIQPREFDGITTWNVVDADGTGHTLDLSESVTIRTAEAPPPSPTSFVLEQAGNQYQLDALATGQSVEEFYSDGSTATGIEESATSRLFFWNDPEEETEIGPVDEVSLGIVNGETSGVKNLEFGFSGLPEDGEWVVQDSGSFERTRAEWNLSSEEPTGGAYRDAADQETELQVEPGWAVPNPFELLELDLPGYWSPVRAADEWHHLRYVEPDEVDGRLVEGLEPPVWIVAMSADEEYLRMDSPPEQPTQTYELESRGTEYQVVPHEGAPEPNDLYLVVQPRIGGTPRVKVAARSTDIPAGTDLLFEGQQVIEGIRLVDPGVEETIEDYAWPIDHWHALTGDPDDPFVYHLDVNEEATIRPGTVDAPLRSEIQAKIGDLKWLLNQIEDEAASVVEELQDTPFEWDGPTLYDPEEVKDNLHNNIREFIDFVERHYEEVSGPPLEQFDEALYRAIQSHKITAAAISEPPEAFRKTVELGATGMVLGALTAVSTAVAQVGDVSRAIGSSGIARRAYDTVVEEMASFGRQIERRALDMDRLPPQVQRWIRSAKETLERNLADELRTWDEDDVDELIGLFIGSGSQTAWETGKEMGLVDSVLEIINAFFDRITLLLYLEYLFGQLGQPRYIDPPDDDLLRELTESPIRGLAALNVDFAAELRADDLDNAFDNRAFMSNGQEWREEQAENVASRIESASERVLGALEKIEETVDFAGYVEIVVFVFTLLGIAIALLLGAGSGGLGSALTVLGLGTAAATVIGGGAAVLAGIGALLGSLYAVAMTMTHEVTTNSVTNWHDWPFDATL